MRKFIKIIAVVLTAMAFLFSVGCGNNGPGGIIGGEVIESYDETKTILKVASYNGGVGVQWLYNIAKEFEDTYADYEFEPGSGKKGVQIAIDASKNKPDASLSTSSAAVFFTEGLDYASFVSGNSFLNITDIVTRPLNTVVKTDENKTIESKLFEGSKDYLTFRNNEYYALPHYSFWGNISYNKQIFIDKKLYFKDGVTSVEDITDYFIQTSNDVKSCGPDGVMGNEDDGLPATYEEMFILCDYMATVKNVTPFIWTGKYYPGYFKYLLSAVYFNLTGKEELEYNFLYDSGEKTIDIIESFTGNTPNITQSAVNKANYKNVLNRQLTKYQALEIGEKVFNTAIYRSKFCKDSTCEMLDAQKEFILSANENNPIGMLVEGSYWYNEAAQANYIEDAKGTYGVMFDKKNEFNTMPLPRVYSGTNMDIKGQTVGKNVIADCADSYAFINANISGNENMVKLAKTFLAFCYTDSALENFTVTTNIPKYVKYDIDDSLLSTDYGKSLWASWKNSDIARSASGEDMYLNDRGTWAYFNDSNFWNAPTYQHAPIAFNSGVSVIEFFKDTWNK